MGLLEVAYRDLTGAAALMQCSDEDSKAFAEAAVPESCADYGEMLPEGVLDMLWRVGAKPGDQFYDLGSGAGKAVLLAWMIGLRATGLELAPSRWEASRQALRVLEQMASAGGMPQGSDASKCGLPERARGSLDFMCGNPIEVDFTDADIILVASVQFPSSVVAQLAETARWMKPGSITVSNKLFPGPDFRELGEFLEPTTWRQSGTLWKLQVVERSEGGPDRHSFLLPCDEFDVSRRSNFVGGA